MEKITSLRQEIDKIDNNIIDIIKKRFDVVEDVSCYKKNTIGNEFLYIDPTREHTLIKKQVSFGEILDINGHMIKNIYRNFISFANFHEQPNLKIYIPENINNDAMQLITSYYPIQMCYFFISHFNIKTPSANEIFAIEMESLPSYVNFLQENSMHIYHLEHSLKSNKSIAFCGKILKLYMQDDGIFIFANKSNQIVEMNFEKYKENIQNPELSFLGSYAILQI